MKHIILIAALFITIPVLAQPNKTRLEDEKTLRHLKEVEWPKAYREQDTVLLNSILADEFQMIDMDGEYSNKRDQLDYIKQHKPGYTSFRFVIKRLDIFENNTAVVAGTGIIKGTDKEGDYEVRYQSSNVLIKRNGNWKAISSHTSGDKTIRVQDSIHFTGKNFFAIAVANTDAVSKWYEDLFKLKLVKEIKNNENGVHIRIIENEFLQVEVLQHSLSKPFNEANTHKGQQAMLQHIFKTGFYVTKLDEALSYFKSENVKIKNGPFEDKEMKIRSIIIEDPWGNLVQLAETMP